MGEFERYNGHNSISIKECEIHGDNLHVTRNPFIENGYVGVCYKCGKEFSLDIQKLEEQFNV